MWLLWLILAFAHATETNWPGLSTRAEQAYRAQRDIALGIPLDQLTPFGISANRLIFDVEGYSRDSLSTLNTVLNVGINAVMLDIYWNEYTKRWQLCPAPIPLGATTNSSETVEVSWKGNKYRCQPDFKDNDVYTTLRDYLRLLNINSQANVVRVILNLKLIANDTVVVRTNTSDSSTAVTGPVPTSISPGMVVYLPSYMEIGNTSLLSPLSTLGSFLYKPSDMDMTSPLNTTVAYDDEYPSQQDFLYSLYKRTYVTALSHEFRNSSRGYNMTDDDHATLFVFGKNNFTLSENLGDVLQECLRKQTGNYDPQWYKSRVQRSKFRTLIDTEDEPFSPEVAHSVLQCGYTPVLNATRYAISNRINLTSEYAGSVINQYIPYAFWSWGPFEPNNTFTNRTSDSLHHTDVIGRSLEGEFDGNNNGNDGLDDSEDDEPDWQETAIGQVAEKCVTIKPEGWALENCYNKYRLACKHTTNSFDWTISDEIALYFGTNQPRCPKNYFFSIPHLSTEQLALKTYLNSTGVDYPVWVDMNDVTILGCFVTGGPYAECPYRRAVTTSNLIRLIAPSAVVAVVILILIFFERFFLMTPIHTNRRRHWKRVINQHNKKNDYEGVPS